MWSLNNFHHNKIDLKFPLEILLISELWIKIPLELYIFSEVVMKVVILYFNLYDFKMMNLKIIETVSQLILTS